MWVVHIPKNPHKLFIFYKPICSAARGAIKALHKSVTIVNLLVL